MSATHQLTLFMPDLLTAAQGQSLPALATLLGKAEATSSLPAMDLLGLFNLADTAPPMAALTAIGDGLTVQGGEWWLRADPVMLQADQATVYLIATHLQLDAAEVSQLLNTLNPFLQQDGLQLLAPQPQRWYIKLAKSPGLQGIAPEPWVGQSIKAYLATGSQHAYWRRLFSELQILLHDHPVNRQRQTQHKSLVNGLWFWGEGCLPLDLPRVTWTKVWTNSVLGRGLARWSNIETLALPQTFADIEQPLQQVDSHYLFIVPELRANDVLHWDEHWFAPLITALQTRRVSQVTFYIGQQRFILNHNTIRRWWRSRYKF